MMGAGLIMELGLLL